ERKILAFRHAELLEVRAARRCAERGEDAALRTLRLELIRRLHEPFLVEQTVGICLIQHTYHIGRAFIKPLVTNGVIIMDLNRYNMKGAAHIVSRAAKFKVVVELVFVAIV